MARVKGTPRAMAATPWDRAEEDEKKRASRLPSPIRFPLVCILSLSFASLGHCLLSLAIKGELTSVSRVTESSKEIALFAARRLAELAVGWFGNFDSNDVASLTLLSHGPSLYLLTTFYGIRPSTAAASLCLEVLSSYLPFFLLRPVSKAHSASPGVFNREIITDRVITVFTVLVAGLIYHVTLFVAFKTFLPTLLVIHFDGIRTVEPANEAVLFGTFPTMLLSLLFGLAARALIFTPSAAQPPTGADARVLRFDPSSATLTETIWWNLWGFTTSTKVAIGRTAVVMAVTGLNTFLQCRMVIRGVDFYGATMYSLVWVTAALATGLMLRYVGGV